MAAKYTQASFLCVDVDECKQTSEQNGIRAMPTVILFSKKQKLESMKGPSPDALEAEIEKRAKSLAPAKRAVWGSEPASAGTAAGGGGNSLSSSAAPQAEGAGSSLGLSEKQQVAVDGLAAAFTLTPPQAEWLLRNAGWNADTAAMAHLSNPGGAEEAVGAAPCVGSTGVGTGGPSSATGSGAAAAGSAIATGAKDDAVEAAAAAGAGSTCRLQFRMGGFRATASLPSSMTIGQVFRWVGARIDAGVRFTLSVRRTAAEQDELSPESGNTLVEAGLSPRGLVLVDAEGATKFEGAKAV